MMMPSITEMPNSAMNPIAAETLNGIPVSSNPTIPPNTAIGITLMVKTVSTTDPKFDRQIPLRLFAVDISRARHQLYRCHLAERHLCDAVRTLRADPQVLN